MRQPIQPDTPEYKVSFPIMTLMGADILAFLGAILLSLRLHFDTMSFSDIFLLRLHPHLISLPFVLIAYLFSLNAFRLYRYAWRFASLEMLWGILCANSVGLVALIVIQTLLDGFTFRVPVLFTIWLLSLFLVGGMRILLRLANISRSHGFQGLNGLHKDVQPKRVVILGGGTDGVRLLASLREEMSEPYEVIGFLDDAPDQTGMYIRGVQVLGSFTYLYKLLADRAIDEVLVATSTASGESIRDYVMACRKQRMPVKIIPGLADVLQGKTQARLEEISVEDLLRRPPVRINSAEMGCFLSGRRVLVTGAGGSIGSELCRQISALAPSRLVLLGHGENSIHRIHQELSSAHPELANRLYFAIGSVSDDVRMDQIFREHRPEVVFHAAAHKHVPIMEANVPEAVQNNVLGTQCIAEACGRYHIERMLLISTDKAVYPSSIMGATKWLCEEVVRGLSQTYTGTRYVTVRFGNVLGSRGSVVPIFRDQIKRGGPVTITHPEVTRYFMTIPEAVQLVLQAGAIGHSGELFLLNMGKPIKIADLARDMIRLSGYEPDVDIPIIYSGMRPGEKLHEALASDEEIIEPANCEGLSIVHRRQYFAASEVRAVVKRLQQLASNNDTVLLLDFIGELIPSFASHRLLADAIILPDTEQFV